jgi:hypothetical protein
MSKIGSPPWEANHHKNYKGNPVVSGGKNGIFNITSFFSIKIKKWIGYNNHRERR